jgi:hypothetical protein
MFRCVLVPAASPHIMSGPPRSEHSQSGILAGYEAPHHSIPSLHRRKAATKTARRLAFAPKTDNPFLSRRSLRSPGKRELGHIPAPRTNQSLQLGDRAPLPPPSPVGVALTLKPLLLKGIAPKCPGQRHRLRFTRCPRSGSHAIRSNGHFRAVPGSLSLRSKT